MKSDCLEWRAAIVRALAKCVLVDESEREREQQQHRKGQIDSYEAIEWRRQKGSAERANGKVCVCQITQFCINCFSSDEAHKFSHKYFAVERIFTVEMQLMPLMFGLYLSSVAPYLFHSLVFAFIPFSVALIMYRICTAFHQFKHYVSQFALRMCVCVCSVLFYSSSCVFLIRT